MSKVIKFARGLFVGMKLRKIQKSVEQAQAKFIKESASVREYNHRLQPKRDEMDRRIQALYQKINSEELIELYLIYFSAVGAQMVTPAHEWLIRWGEGFIRLRFEDIGRHLIEHAKEEIGHDRWHLNDVKFLVSHYNKKFNADLDVESILRQGHANCVRRYEAAFRTTIESDSEHMALGMLYETELMTFTLAPKFIGHCVQELGLEIMRGLSFLRGHIVSDVGHVQENAEQLQEVLETHPSPEKLADIVYMGEETVNVYIDYFEQVAEMALKNYHSRQSKYGAKSA